MGVLVLYRCCYKGRFLGVQLPSGLTLSNVEHLIKYQIEMASWLWGDDTLSLAVVSEAVNSEVNQDLLWVYVMFSSHSEPTDTMCRPLGWCLWWGGAAGWKSATKEIPVLSLMATLCNRCCLPIRGGCLICLLQTWSLLKLLCTKHCLENSILL